jgi:hypothetical protein
MFKPGIWPVEGCTREIPIHTSLYNDDPIFDTRLRAGVLGLVLELLRFAAKVIGCTFGFGFGFDGAAVKRTGIDETGVCFRPASHLPHSCPASYFISLSYSQATDLMVAFFHRGK